MSVEISQLEDHLNKLPAQIRDAELEVIDAENEVENAKLEYDVFFGMSLIGAKKNNATEKKAEATVLSEEKAKILLQTRYDLKKKQAELNYLNDRFIAIRKIASIEEKLIKPNLTGY